MHRSNFIKVVILGCLVGLAACGDDSTVVAKDAGSHAVSDAGIDAAAHDAAYPATDAGPIPECITVAAVTCDGPEDCPKGKQCCGGFDGAGYSEFKCADSCPALEADGGIWSELCHAGQKCEADGYTCRTSAMYLPAFLARCRDSGEAVTKQASVAAGEVNCGKDVCGTDEHCCLRAPKEPYCLSSAQACTCEDPVKVTPDASVQDDAGKGDAG